MRKSSEALDQHGPGNPDPTRPVANQETPTPGASEFSSPPRRYGAVQPRGRPSTQQEAAAEFAGEDGKQPPPRSVVRGGYVGRPPE